jgi:chromosomal replication initiator protein
MLDDCQKSWKEISDLLRKEIGENNWQRWFAEVTPVELTEERCVLQLPNSIHQFFIESNYEIILTSAISAVTGHRCEICFQCPAEAEDDLMRDATQSPRELTDPVPAKDSASGAFPAPKSQARRQEPKRDKIKELAIASRMNRHYVFSEFVVGAGNEFAHAAGRAVAEAPAKRYNPLFLYGGSGLGKTHLMHAIGLHVLEKFPKKKVVFISSEEWTNEFIDAIQNGKLVPFRKRFRQADVLLIDDIHFLGGKERSQEEFFHTFNSLFDGHKQIVLSSDKPPSEINGLEHRLVSRFEWGLTAQVLLPDVETRHAILRKKAHRMNIPVDDRILNFLAEHIRTNVRRLEGALTRVGSYASLSAHSLSLEDVEGLLRDFLREECQDVTIETIQKIVCKHYNLRPSDMLSKQRPAHIAGPRQVAMYLCRRHTRNSLVEIGEAFGGRDHGTVLHACKTVEKKSREQDKMRNDLALLENQLNSAG